MKKLLIVILILLNINTMAYGKENLYLIGIISAFECGDNCYLTIVDTQGQEHPALCSDANICESMMNAIDDPSIAGYKNKRVKVTITQGTQVDGSGNIMGTMDAFENITILK